MGQLKNQRSRQSRRHLPDLYARQHGLCRWCLAATAIVRFVPEEDIVRETVDDITFRIGTEVVSARVATLDHVDPVRNGSPDAHDPGNFVMECAECNRNRTRTVSLKPGKVRRLCPNCLGPKDAAKRQCGRCKAAKTIGWLLAHGWVETPGHHEGRTMFADPKTGEAHILRHACKILRSAIEGQTCSQPK